MPEDNLVHTLTNNPKDIPVPVVNFSRWVYLITLLASLVAQQPLGTTFLFVILLPSIFLGNKWSVIGQIGKALFIRGNNKPLQYEDKQLIFFNNIILISLLTIAQIFFILELDIIAWSAIGLLIIANGLALAGYCVGCVIYYRFKIYKYKLFGKN